MKPIFEITVSTETNHDPDAMLARLEHAREDVALVRASLRPFRDATGLSQAAVSSAAGITTSRFGEIENDTEPTVRPFTIREASRLLEAMARVTRGGSLEAEGPVPEPELLVDVLPVEPEPTLDGEA